MVIDREVDPGRINNGQRFGLGCHAAYDLLAHLEPGLCVDVGAAIGKTARRILERSPQSRVTAYEPYAGNRAYLEAAVGGDARVTIRPVAVSDHAGTGSLMVPKPNRNSGGWAATMPGYSPLGRLTHSDEAGGVAVETVTLDDEISERVRFLKVDVQGGELKVLKGTSNLMAGPGIDIIYVEFSGSLAVAEWLRARGYTLFDCAYMVRPTRRYLPNWFQRRNTWRLPDWPAIDSGTLSTGARYAYVWPSMPFRTLPLYCAWFVACRAILCGMQTDLLCIHERILPVLLDRSNETDGDFR